MIENRKYPRVAIRVPIYIALQHTVFRKTVRLESTDVSAGGVAFATSQEITLDAQSSVVLTQLGDLGGPALIHGRVARIIKAPETGRYTVAVEFTGFEGTSREELVERIEKWKG